MINFYNQVPTIYSSASRDFQYLSWLINIVLNSVKHNIDDLYHLPARMPNSNLNELLAFTLGFKVRRNYDQIQLGVIASILPSILKHKGSIKALEIIGNALVKASGAQGEFSVEVIEGEIHANFPKELVDITLFIDLLPYILPAGMTCRITRLPQTKSAFKTNIEHNDIIHFNPISDIVLARLTPTDIDNAEIIKTHSILSNYGKENAKDSVSQLNIGLLSNTVVPALDPESQFNSGLANSTNLFGKYEEISSASVDPVNSEEVGEQNV